jgi:integrase
MFEGLHARECSFDELCRCGPSSLLGVHRLSVPGASVRLPHLPRGSSVVRVWSSRDFPAARYAGSYASGSRRNGGVPTIDWLNLLAGCQRGDAYATVTGISKLLSLLLADAADARLIAANPIRARRRGHRAPRPARIWATPEEVLAVADNAARLPASGPGAAVMIFIAGWTGARWDEITGLQRTNTYLDDEHRFFRIDAQIGALIESSQGLELGPPKTAESARPVSLPPSLTRLLRAHLATHDHPHVFITPSGELHRRSNFARRVLRPAADGTHHQRRPVVSLRAAKPGLTFHGLRHGHKTWMIADGIPEVAQSRRLGHLLDDKIQETCSHVATEVETRLLQALEDRWNKAIADSGESPDWRAAAGLS